MGRFLIQSLKALLVLAVLFIVCLPAGLGWYLDRQLYQRSDALTDWLAEHGFPQAQLSIQRQHFAWLYSDYRIAVTLQAGNDTPDLRLNSRLQHGPLNWEGLTRGQWHWQLASSATQWQFESQLLPDLNTQQQLDFKGQLRGDWRFLGYRGQHGERRFDIANSSGRWHYQPDSRSLEAELSLPDLRLRLGEHALQLSEFLLALSVSGTGTALPVGDARITLGTARWREPGRDWRLRNFRWQGLFSDYESLSNFQWSARSDSLELNQYALNQLEVDSALRGISKSSVQALMPDQGWGTWKETWSILSQQWQQRAGDIVANSEFEVAHLAVQTPEGPVRGFLRTNVPPTAELETSQASALLSAMDLSAEVSVPQTMMHALLEDSGIQERFFVDEHYRFLKKKTSPERLREMAEKAAKQQLKMVVSQGLIAAGNGQYWTQIRLKEGQLSLNRQSVYDFTRSAPQN
ncbi:hypothetical protein GP5015_1609 [gamma proteobacterium HTCC5015]|nr:hypothetical protein GP5015_1609 [gamma proteobacterium HTCC5015]